MGTDRQYKGSKCIIELDNIMRSHQDSRSSEHEVHGVVGRACTTASLLNKWKKRLKTARERQQEKQSSPNNIGSYQVEVHGMTSVVKPKKRTKTCGFCGGPHKHLTCNKNQAFMIGARVYELTNGSNHVANELKNRI